MIPLPSQPLSKCAVNKQQLAPALKKALGKAKGAARTVLLDKATHEVVAARDLAQLGTLFLESPLILVPEFDLLNLIELGKVCAYCGGVLKVDEKGRLRDAKDDRKERKGTARKRFMQGLDCDKCATRWCSEECKDADLKHCLLNHRPENKSCTHPIVDRTGQTVGKFQYDAWTALRKYIVEHDLEVCYCGVVVFLQILLCPELEQPFLGLRKPVGAGTEALVRLLVGVENVTRAELVESHELLKSCFSQGCTISFARYVQVLALYKLNNFNGSVYLVTSSLKRTGGSGANCRIESHDCPDSVIDSFKLKAVSGTSVELTQESFVEDSSRVAVYHSAPPVNKSGGRPNKRILKVVNLEKLRRGDVVAVRDVDYSFAAAEEDAISLEEDDVDLHRLSTSSLLQPLSHKRTPSFTSSGGSFGEGIIKYNRAQIREMLKQLSLESGIEEEDGESISLDSSSVMFEVPATFGRSRSKSVRFDDTIVSI